MKEPPRNPDSEPASRAEPRDALAFAIRLHQRGEVQQAAELYRRILEIEPEQPDALHFLGLAAFQRGEPQAGLELIRRSLGVRPDNPSALNNLGNLLRLEGKLDEAAEAYQRSLAVSPENAEALNNLGTIVRARGHLAAAIAFFEHALAASPNHLEALHHLGHTLLLSGAHDSGLSVLKHALTLTPHDGSSYRRVGAAYSSLGRTPDAAEVYKVWLELQPTNLEARHLLSACTGELVPRRAPDEYVKTTFDRFADSFDRVLEGLRYRAPALVENAVAEAFGAPRGALRVLDAGCGTGLGGVLLRPYAARLDGVDLSPRMLAAARARRIYDELVVGELTAFLEGHSRAYDLVVSIDTLVYFGDLTQVTRAFATSLDRDGRVVFTVERADEGEAPRGYRLNPHGRFAQSESYVRRVLDDAGLILEHLTRCELRLEGQNAVAGLVVVAARVR